MTEIEAEKEFTGHAQYWSDLQFERDQKKSDLKPIEFEIKEARRKMLALAKEFPFLRDNPELPVKVKTYESKGGTDWEELAEVLWNLCDQRDFVIKTLCEELGESFEDAIALCDELESLDALKEETRKPSRTIKRIYRRK